MENSYKPSEVKLEDQRIWPYPNWIEQGDQEVVIKGGLKRTNFLGDGAKLIDSEVISDFNHYVFGPKLVVGRSNWKIHIKSDQTLSSDDLKEGYQLKVHKQGIEIEATSYVGAVYALMTLSQLIRKKRGRYVIENTPLRIVDSPNVRHRAIMLDTSRHFIPVEVIKKQIRGMAYNKLNKLHLHLTDGQSFPLAVGPSTDKIAYGNGLANEGAYSNKEVYTLKDVRKIIEYAKARGITVFPEIDTPGHTYSWKAGFKNIMTCDTPDYQAEVACPEPPCGFFDLKNKMEEVKTVVKDVWKEVIDAFRIGQQGYGRQIHIGFDEVACPNMVDGECVPNSCGEAYGEPSVKYANWLLEWIKVKYPNIETIMWADQVLTSNFPEGKYQEIIKADKERVIFQFWNLDSSTPGLLKQLADKGYRLINSQSTVYYLDAGGNGDSFVNGGPIITIDNKGKRQIDFQKNWITTYPGVTKATSPSSGWFISWEEIYQNNPTYLTTDLYTSETENFVEIPITKCKKGGIMGVTAPLWGEQVDHTNIDQKLWPRVSALAESLWRFNKTRSPDNILNARYRLVYTREDLLCLGLQAQPMVPADVFRKAPWGTKNSKTPLMYDINQKRQQLPEGYTFNYRRFWTKKFCEGTSINPFCASANSSTMRCDNKGAPYVQEGCPYNDAPSSESDGDSPHSDDDNSSPS